MVFQSLLEQFQALPFGTDSFKQLKNHCEQQIKTANLALEQTALFLIYGFAKNYVLLYEDQAVTAQFSNAAKTQLLTYMQQLNAALATQDKALILERLNQVTQDYMHSSRVF